MARRGAEPVRQPTDQEIIIALLELFSVVDFIFTEDDAFVEHRKSLGRIHVQWKKSRSMMDPDFIGKRRFYHKKRYRKS